MPRIRTLRQQAVQQERRAAVAAAAPAPILEEEQLTMTRAQFDAAIQAGLQAALAKAAMPLPPKAAVPPPRTASPAGESSGSEETWGEWGRKRTADGEAVAGSSNVPPPPPPPRNPSGFHSRDFSPLQANHWTVIIFQVVSRHPSSPGNKYNCHIDASLQL